MQNLTENKRKIFSKNAIICLGIIALTGFLIRFFYFPEGIPITLDGALYFWYANDLSVSGVFSDNLRVVNNGWPTFLSVFFYFFSLENFLDYMELQRSITIIISVATIIPVYVLCRKFCGNGLSLLGASLFVFQPRVIENSLLGLSEPLFILLELSCLVLFLQNNWKFKYLSFAFLALACLVRYEGIVLIIPLSIFFLLKNRDYKIIIPRFLIALSIFLLVLLPMIFVRMETMGYDGIFSHSVAAIQVSSGILPGDTLNAAESIFFLIKSTALSIFPIFFIFLPLGIFGFFRNRNFDKYTVLLFLIFMFIPIIYASVRGAAEPRYLLTIFPILSLFSVFTAKEIIKKFNKTKLITIVFIIGILSLSIFYLDYNKIDYEYELDVYHVGLEVSKRTSVINDYYPEVVYVHNKIDVASYSDTFPILSSEINQKVELIETHEYDSLNEFIDYAKNKGLTHIVVDENKSRQQFLKDVFENEEKFSYLTKIYDSVEQGYNYHLKIFTIDYEKFESIEFN